MIKNDDTSWISATLAEKLRQAQSGVGAQFNASSAAFAPQARKPHSSLITAVLMKISSEDCCS